MLGLWHAHQVCLKEKRCTCNALTSSLALHLSRTLLTEGLAVILDLNSKGTAAAASRARTAASALPEAAACGGTAAAKLGFCGSSSRCPRKKLTMASTSAAASAVEEAAAEAAEEPANSDVAQWALRQQSKWWGFCCDAIRWTLSTLYVFTCKRQRSPSAWRLVHGH